MVGEEKRRNEGLDSWDRRPGFCSLTVGSKWRVGEISDFERLVSRGRFGVVDGSTTGRQRIASHRGEAQVEGTRDNRSPRTTSTQDKADTCNQNWGKATGVGENMCGREEV